MSYTHGTHVNTNGVMQKKISLWVASAWVADQGFIPDPFSVCEANIRATFHDLKRKLRFFANSHFRWLIPSPHQFLWKTRQIFPQVLKGCLP